MTERIVPAQSGAELLADIDTARRSPGQVHLWWLGQSGFLVQWRGKHLLLDPYLSDSLTRKYAATDRPHIRMTRQVLAARQLPDIEVVTSSHRHTDHLDPETLGPLLEEQPRTTLVVPRANVPFAVERLQVAPERLAAIDDGGCVRVGDFEIHAVPAAHESLDRDAAGNCLYLGYVVRLGDHVIYHSGDTVLYEGLVERLRQWPIEVALLPINGRAPERGVAGNLWGREAAQLAHAIGAGTVIPCHYEMFTFNTASPDEFVAEARRLGQGYCLLRAGERFSWPE